MLEEIGFYEAKTKLPDMLRRVEAGEAFTITNRGKPIADLVPSRSSDRLKAQAAISNILKAAKRKVSEVSDRVLKEHRETGRK